MAKGFVNLEVLSVSTVEYEEEGKGMMEHLRRSVIRHYICPDIDPEPLKQGDIVVFRQGPLRGEYMVLKKVMIPPPVRVRLVKVTRTERDPLDE